MAYRFERGEPLPDGVRRIVREQLRGALDGLEDPSRLGIEGTVHDVRKRGKKVRGLARLVRGAIGREGFQAVNAPVRDAGAELSPMRDAHAILATFDRLVAVDPSQLAHGEAGAVRSELQRRSLAASPDEAEGAERIRRAAALLETALSASQRWRLRDERVLERGVRRIYARGQAALRMSQSSGEIETRHEWRKREKDLWYAIRLLAPTAPSVLSAWEMRLDELADALGDDHDLAVLTDMLTSQPDAFGGASSVDPVLALADRVAVDLQDRAYRLGATLYSEPPRTFGRRMGRYWQIWHTLGDEHTVGGLDEIQ